MDINYLLSREQIERAHARSAADPFARTAHEGLADLYRSEVDAYRHGNGAPGPLTSCAPLAAAEPQAA
ncbi:MAG: hypothetical protein JWL74_1463 [Alphaproteobacteria bacterium]|jgi:hypothetical protein|nr:hypothetical protein [Alphaproteobacteria bacterium]